MATVASCWSIGAQAYSGGITGYSENPAHPPVAPPFGNSINCTECHSDGAIPAYSANVSGPSVVTPSSTGNSYTFNLNGSGALGNDTDSDTGDAALLTAAVVTGPTNGTLNLNGNGTYTPTPFTFGTDSFTYRATDNGGLFADATVTLNVQLVAFPPVGNVDSYSTQEEQTLNVTAPGVLGNDSDPNNLALTAVIGTPPSHGTLMANSNGSFTYVPDANYQSHRA